MFLMSTKARHVVMAVLAVVAMLCSSVLLYAPARAETTSNDVTWTVRTGDTDLGSGRSSFSYVLNPGASVTDELVIANRGTEALTLNIYAADGFTNDSGALDVRGNEGSVGIGAWTKGKKQTVTVTAGKTATVPFTVAVPNNAIPGDYVGGILTTLTQPDSATGVNVDRRLGVRIAVRVGGDIVPRLSVEDAHLDWSGALNPLAVGDATLTYRVHNTGNSIINSVSTTQIAGPFGWFPSQVVTTDVTPDLLPGESWTVTVTVPNIWALLWLTSTSSVTPSTTDMAGSTTSLQPITVATSTLGVPWVSLIVLLVIALAVFFGIRFFLARRRLRLDRERVRIHAAVERALAESGVEQALAASGVDPASVDVDDLADEEDGDGESLPAGASAEAQPTTGASRQRFPQALIRRITGARTSKE